MVFLELRKEHALYAFIQLQFIQLYAYVQLANLLQHTKNFQFIL